MHVNVFVHYMYIAFQQLTKKVVGKLMSLLLQRHLYML